MKKHEELIEQIYKTNNYWVNAANRVIDLIEIRKSEGKETKFVNLLISFDRCQLQRFLIAGVLYQDGDYVGYSRDNIERLYSIVPTNESPVKKMRVRRVKRFK